MELEPCAHCGVPDAPLLCSACRAVRYCGVGCQSADWKGVHKPRCGFLQVTLDRFREPTGDFTAPNTESIYEVNGFPAGRALSSALSALPARERATAVSLFILAFDIGRVMAAFHPSSGVTTTMRADIVHKVTGKKEMTLLMWAARNLWNSLTLPPELHDAAIAIWEVVVAAAPLSQLNSADDTSFFGTPTSVLHHVCRYSARALTARAVDVLLDRGVEVNPSSIPNISALLSAIYRQPAAVVGKLLAAGANHAVRYPPREETVLHYLAGMECPAAAAKVQLLVDAGADLEVTNSLEFSPLRLAISSHFGSLRAFDALLAAGASTAPLWQLLPAPFIAVGARLSALHIACITNNVSGARRLLALSPESTEVDASSGELCRESQPTGLPLANIIYGATALHLAVTSRQPTLTNLLIAAGADVHALDARSRTPLLIACNYAAPRETIESLLSAGAADTGPVFLAGAALYSCNLAEGISTDMVTQIGPHSMPPAEARANNAGTLALLLDECARRRLAVPQDALRRVPVADLPAPFGAQVGALIRQLLTLST